jgi:hypothetical protein
LARIPGFFADDADTDCNRQQTTAHFDEMPLSGEISRGKRQKRPKAHRGRRGGTALPNSYSRQNARGEARSRSLESVCAIGRKTYFF